MYHLTDKSRGMSTFFFPGCDSIVTSSNAATLLVSSIVLHDRPPVKDSQWIFGPSLFLLIEKLNVAKDYIDFDSQFLEY